MGAYIRHQWPTADQQCEAGIQPAAVLLVSDGLPTAYSETAAKHSTDSRHPVHHKLHRTALSHRRASLKHHYITIHSTSSHQYGALE